jgi:hypothetical protein
MAADNCMPGFRNRDMQAISHGSTNDVCDQLEAMRGEQNLKGYPWLTEDSIGHPNSRRKFTCVRG